MIRLLASINVSETDKKLIIVLIIFLIIVLLLLGLFGMAVRFVMHRQGKRIDSVMHDCVKTHVVNTPSQFKKLARKKSARLLFKDSLIPFLIGLVALLTWVFANIATSKWNENIFDHFDDLTFKLDWSGTFVKTIFWFHPLPIDWPTVSRPPVPRVDHIVSYVVVFLIFIAILYYAYACQAYLARHFMIRSRARTIYEKSLENYNANSSMDNIQGEPLPPQG